MNKIQINGTQKFMGIDIPIVEGGFGEGKRCLSDKTIADIHNQPVPEIRKSVGRNIKRFKENIDYIDLGRRSNEITTLEFLLDLGYAKQSVTQAEHIYFLSERGYAKLIKIMDSDLAWEIHDELIDEYFTMRNVINSSEQKKANLLLSIYKGGQEAILATKDLVTIEVKEATAPLIADNERMKPKEEFHDAVSDSTNLIDMGKMAKLMKEQHINIGRNRLFQWLRDCEILMYNNVPYQRYIDSGYFQVKESVYTTSRCESKTQQTTYVTGKGQIYIIKKYKKYQEAA